MCALIWISHREFIISPQEVVLNFYPPPGRLIHASHEQVTQWRRQEVGLLGIIFAIKVMFLLHVVARCGGFDPAVFTRPASERPS